MPQGPCRCGSISLTQFYKTSRFKDDVNLFIGSQLVSLSGLSAVMKISCIDFQGNKITSFFRENISPIVSCPKAAPNPHIDQINCPSLHPLLWPHFLSKNADFYITVIVKSTCLCSLASFHSCCHVHHAGGSGVSSRSELLFKVTSLTDPSTKHRGFLRGSDAFAKETINMYAD